MLDASAVLALLHREPGGGRVQEYLGRAAMTTVNLAEVMRNAVERGLPVHGFLENVEGLGLAMFPFTREDAQMSARIWPQTRGLGLSLADRACLALALRLGLPAITADRAWAQLHIGVEIRLVR